MSLKECLEVLENDRTYSLFTELKNKISTGESIQETMEQILDKRITGRFTFFTQFLSLEKSLKCALSLISLETSIQTEMIKKCIYPLLMLFLTILLSLSFNFFFFPIMIDLLESFKSESGHLMMIAACLKIMSVGLILIMIFFGFLIAFFLQKSKVGSAYEFLCKHFKIPFLRRLFSYYYVRYFLELLCIGCSTQKSIQLMKNTKDHPIVNLYSYRINELLLMGKSIKEAFQLDGFDPILSQFVAVGAYSSKMEDMLENYCALTKKEIEKKVKKITGLLQCTMYSFIGIILIFIYQILLSPMNIITQI